jgi:AhpD family alkylhydroperoxidase
MKSTLSDIAETRKWAHRRLGELRSKTYSEFLNLEAVTFSEGRLPRKVKELIALGVAVRIDCESCMQWHIEQAAKAEATWEEVLEAVEVGIEMGGGPATVSARFALKVMEAVFPDLPKA